MNVHVTCEVMLTKLRTRPSKVVKLTSYFLSICNFVRHAVVIRQSFVEKTFNKA